MMATKLSIEAMQMVFSKHWLCISSRKPLRNVKMFWFSAVLTFLARALTEMLSRIFYYC